jgi:hypothetical protein
MFWLRFAQGSDGWSRGQVVLEHELTAPLLSPH